MFIAFAVVGALFGVGAGYVIGKYLNNIEVRNMQQAEIVKG
ncbi:MAG: hypothetical protein ACR5KV_02440 [Wolbachia sp.]